VLLVAECRGAPVLEVGDGFSGFFLPSIVMAGKIVAGSVIRTGIDTEPVLYG